MKDPHAKYTYEYELVRCTGRGVEEIPGYWPTHVAIYRRQIKSDADGYQHTQWLLDIPMSEVQFSAPEKITRVDGTPVYRITVEALNQQTKGK